MPCSAVTLAATAVGAGASVGASARRGIDATGTTAMPPTGLHLRHGSLVVLLLLAACRGSGSEPAGDEPAPPDLPWPAIERVERVPPLDVEPEPAWRSDDLDVAEVEPPHVLGSAAVVAGTDRPGTTDRDLLVVDATTGAERWRVSSLEPLPDGSATAWVPELPPARAAAGTDQLVVVTWQGGDEWGVTALALTDGRTRWRVAMRGEDPPTVQAADDRTVVVRGPAVVAAPGEEPAVPPGAGGPDGDGDDGDPDDGGGGRSARTTTVLDAATGTPRWHDDGFEVVALAGEVVVGRVEGDGGPVLEARAAADGAVRWRAAGLGPLVAVTGSGDALVTGPGRDRPRTAVVRTADGSVVDLGPGVGPCAAGPSHVACLAAVGTGRHLVTLGTDEAEPRASAVPVTVDGALVALDDHRFAAGGDAPFDRAGSPTGDRLPGPPISAAVARGYVVVAGPGGDGWAVHRVAEPPG